MVSPSLSIYVSFSRGRYGISRSQMVGKIKNREIISEKTNRAIILSSRLVGSVIKTIEDAGAGQSRVALRMSYLNDIMGENDDTNSDLSDHGRFLTKGE